MTAAAALCGALAWGAYALISRGERSVPGLVVAIAVGMSAYFGAAHLMALPEWTSLRDKLTRRLRRSA